MSIKYLHNWSQVVPDLTFPCVRLFYDDVIKCKHFPRCWPFVRGIHRSPVNSPHKGRWHGALMFSLICAWINDQINNREAGDLKRYRTHYDVTVMLPFHTNIRKIQFPYSHSRPKPTCEVTLLQDLKNERLNPCFLAVAFISSMPSHYLTQCDWPVVMLTYCKTVTFTETPFHLSCADPFILSGTTYYVACWNIANAHYFEVILQRIAYILS